MADRLAIAAASEGSEVEVVSDFSVVVALYKGMFQLHWKEFFYMVFQEIWVSYKTMSVSLLVHHGLTTFH